MDKKKLERINELSRISRRRALTETEAAEQRELRAEYIREFRARMTGILDNSVILYPDGTREYVRDRKKMKKTDKLNLTPDMPLSVVSRGVGETEALGRRLSELLLEDNSLPRYVALYGGLGAGKTSFVRGFVSGLSTARVKSPTFVLVHEYPASPAPVYHFDMYRIEGEDDLYSVGYYDYLSKDGFILVEWSERVPWALPDRRIEVIIENKDIASPDSRQIKMRLICEDRHENTRT